MALLLDQEKTKYEQMWQISHYRDLTGGHAFFDYFADIVEPSKGSTILDIGGGSGRASRAALEYGLKPTLLDFVDARDEDLLDLPFIEQTVWRPIEGKWDYGMCFDVMEHIPVQLTMLSIQNILNVCDEAWFNISNVQDNCGKYIRQRLHVTVMPYKWWLDSLKEISEVIDARDLLHQSAFRVRRLT